MSVFQLKKTPGAERTAPQTSPKRPARSGVMSSTMTSAGAVQHEMDSMRSTVVVTRGNAERCRAGGAIHGSVRRPDSRQSAVLLFELQRPPVSRATTVKRHLHPWTNSAYFVSLSLRALVSTAPSTFVALDHSVPREIRALRKVTSTAHWPTRSKDFY